MNVQLFVAVKAFILHNEKVLLIREASAYDDGVNVGELDLPGGRITPGEKILEALNREVHEETGLHVRIGNAFFVNESWPKPHGEQWQIVRCFFVCYADSDYVQLSKDHDQALWIPPSKYKNYPIIDNLLPVFEAYLQTKK